MPMKNFWTVTLVSSKKFKRLRTKTITAGIQILVGPLKKPPKGATGTHVQSYHFNISRFKTKATVTAWLKKNKIKKWLEFTKPTGLDERWLRVQIQAMNEDLDADKKVSDRGSV